MADHYQQLWKDVTNANGEVEAVRTLAEILTDREGRAFILSLERPDAELCIDILDRGIAKCNLKITEKQVFLDMLRRLAVCHERLPESMIIAGKIEVEEGILVSGGFSDVRRGNYGGRLVAVRTLRVSAQDNILNMRKQFCREVVLWNTLSHPNVLKLAGVQGDMGTGQFTTVSEWMKHGNVMEYIKHNHVNRLGLLYGAAQGLEYLHSVSLVHGDLKGANILMSNDTPPRACLADFGFVRMVRDDPMSDSAQLEGGTTMFMSPELLAPQKFGIEHSIPTPQSDVYAFGLVIFQVLTGGMPFPPRGALVFLIVIDGVRPTKPNNAPALGFSDLLWAFVQRCWDANMKLRPEVAEVVAQLSKATADWDGVMPPHVKAEYVATETVELMHVGMFMESPDSMGHCRIFSEPLVTAQENTTKFELISPSSAHKDPSSTHYPNLGKNYKPPLLPPPRRKWTSFTYLKHRFRHLGGKKSGPLQTNYGVEDYKLQSHQTTVRSWDAASLEPDVGESEF